MKTTHQIIQILSFVFLLGLYSCGPEASGEMVLLPIADESLSGVKAEELTREIKDRMERLGYQDVQVKRMKEQDVFSVSFLINDQNKELEATLPAMFEQNSDLALWPTYQMNDSVIQNFWQDAVLPEGVIHRRDLEIITGMEDVLAVAQDPALLEQARQELMTQPGYPRNMKLFRSLNQLGDETGYGLYMINTEGRAKPKISEVDIQSAEAAMEQNINRPYIQIQLTERASARWAEMTETAAWDRRGIAVIINGEAWTVPRVMGKITGGQLGISINSPHENLDLIAQQLNLGRLSHPLKVESLKVVAL